MNIERARVIMQAEGLDGLVGSTLENCFYLSGVWNLGQDLFPRDTQAYVVTTREAPAAGIMVTSAGEADQTTEGYPTISDAVTYGTFYREVSEGVDLTPAEQQVKRLTLDTSPVGSPVEALTTAIQRAGLERGTIGVDERGPDVALMTKLAERFPDATIRPASATFRRIRMVKTEAERERMIGALRATEGAMRAAVEAARRGITEAELVQVFRESIVKAGAQPGFTLIRFGRGMALGQVTPGDTTLEPGDYLWFDVGCTYRGYRSDIGRVVAFGEASPRLRSLMEAITVGQARAFELMRPGVPARDVFNGAVEAVRQAGIPHYKRHHVGHGIGVEYYDLPILNPGTEIPLEAGMVFEVETPYYELGFGGAFIEDTVLVGTDGIQLLTELPRDLWTIPA